MAKHFFIVGMQRSGTTYLAHILDSHPEIYVARPIGGPQPEPKFFAYRDRFLQGRDFYESCYFCNRSEKILGEKSVCYADIDLLGKHLEIPARIHSFYPEATILFILRNPVQRAISNYFLSVRSQKESRGIEEAILGGPPNNYTTIRDVEYDGVMCPFIYLERGHYVDFIELYEKWFSNIKILISEKFLNQLNPVQGLYEYLGVDKSHWPTCLKQKFNDAPRFSVPPGLEIELQRYYAPEIEKLEDKLNLSLDIWRSITPATKAGACS